MSAKERRGFVGGGGEGWRSVAAVVGDVDINDAAGTWCECVDSDAGTVARGGGGGGGVALPVVIVVVVVVVDTDAEGEKRALSVAVGSTGVSDSVSFIVGVRVGVRDLLEELS